MVSPDHDWGLQFSCSDHLVEAEPEAVTFAVAEPADTCRQSLERDPLPRKVDPAGQRFVLGKLLENRLVGCVDIGGIA